MSEHDEGATPASRTLVCSVLFLDIVGYSRLGVTEAIRVKQRFNEVLDTALQDTPPADRVVIDTGDGAAVTFLGDPERALFAALSLFDNVGDAPVRIGINLGPVYLTKDINGRENVIGDGINVAQRVMSFAQPRQLLLSRAFYDVALLISAEYATMFQAIGGRTDKHERTHEVFAVNPAVRVGRSAAKAHARLRAEPPRTAPAPRDEPVRISDAGSHFIISGTTRERVAATLERLTADGARLLAEPTIVGARWMATCENRRHAVRVSVEQFGLKSIVSGPTREVVEAKVRELLQFGASMVQEIECVDGVWTAVCERS
ncbi:adenylate/guanylate cyclase domain-containing protein [Piscinibacter sp.]|uniref:adenylate/guanylate cyclase domain-containing protein n=1 Tax=Piscinibacter sp. TaxID=1903157 RepID=UPI002C53DCE4|nr:adenylate/guanylate cyclase domain-containing protein [Albitalea sp.]HUG21629.1 adenylate/guanylate cyclase domain-containing protein [Albitalea sp.]